MSEQKPLCGNNSEVIEAILHNGTIKCPYVNGIRCATDNSIVPLCDGNDVTEGTECKKFAERRW
jgi:hypothetical protein